MKNNNFNLSVAMLSFSGLLVLADFAHAEDFAQTAAHKLKSMTEGFGQTSLPVLKRGPARSQPEVSASLLEKLCPTCPVTKKAQGTDLQITGDHLFLSVTADATMAEFRDLAVEAKAHSLATPVEGRMPLASLEKAGRDFITAKLAAVIELGPSEELVPLSTAYRVEGLQNLSTGAVTNTVAANRVVFGRTLNGVLIVGNGSKVIVTFANDGSVESFHYDWPKYDVAATAQSLHNASGLLERVQKAVGARAGFVPVFTVHAPSPNAMARPVDLSTNTKLQSLECGYYDAGTEAGLAQIQPGCLYYAVVTDGTGIRQGFSGAVPGAVTFQPDVKWQESQLLK